MPAQTTRTCPTTPQCLRSAVRCAVAEQVQVRQLSGSGQWIATSGSDAGAAYELDITGAIAHGCTCLAGLNGDAVCKHRAAYYLSIGAPSSGPAPQVSRSGKYVACIGCGRQGNMAGPGRSRAVRGLSWPGPACSNGDSCLVPAGPGLFPAPTAGGAPPVQCAHWWAHVKEVRSPAT